MKHETNGKSNWEQFVLTAVVAGTGIANAERYFSCAAIDRFSR